MFLLNLEGPGRFWTRASRAGRVLAACARVGPRSVQPVSLDCPMRTWRPHTPAARPNAVPHPAAAPQDRVSLGPAVGAPVVEVTVRTRPEVVLLPPITGRQKPHERTASFKRFDTVLKCREGGGAKPGAHPASDGGALCCLISFLRFSSPCGPEARPVQLQKGKELPFGWDLLSLRIT